MMVDEISNKTLAVLLIVAIAISLGGTLVSINRLSSVVKLPGGITGYATAQGTGTTNVSILSTAAIRFSVNNLNFGAGAVNTTTLGNKRCSLASSSTGGARDTNYHCINFTNTPDINSLVIENYGSINLTVNLTSNNSAAGFIGGPEGIELFRYKVTNNEGDSCATPLPSSWTNVVKSTDGEMAVCASAGGLGFNVDHNTLYLDFNLTIPYDSYSMGKGNQQVTITAIGTTVAP